MLRSNLSPIAECVHNSPVIPTRHKNLAPFDTTRRRNNAVSSLYKTALKKRDSAGIISIETLYENDSSASGPIKKPTASLNVVLGHQPHTHKAKTPISHYEHDMNHTLASRSSSATHPNATHRPGPPVRSRSNDVNANIIEAARGNSSRSSIGDSPKMNTGLRQEPSKSSTHYGEHTNGVTEEFHELLSGELLSALNDDIFDGEFIFDNKWTDNSNRCSGTSCVDTKSNRDPSEAYCTVHDCPKKTCSSCLPSNDGKLEPSYSPESKQAVFESGTKSLRFQSKLDTLRLRVQSYQRGSQSLDSEVVSSETRPLQYWSNNATLRAKMVSEGINRELKCVTQASSYAHIYNRKLLLTILSHIPSEERSRRACRMASPLEEKLTIQPVIGSIHSTYSDVSLADYLQKNLDENIDASFQEQLSATVRDRELCDNILRGRDNSRDLWIESEKLEFR